MQVGPPEDWRLEASPAVVEVVEDGGLVGLVHEFEEEGLEEVVPAGPEQEQVVLGLVVVPVSQDEDLSLPIGQSLLALEQDGHCQTFLLLEVLLVDLGAVGNVHFGVVVLEGVFGRAVGEVVHDEDWYLLGLALQLVRLVEHLGGLVELEVDFAGQVEGDLEEPSDGFGFLSDGCVLFVLEVGLEVDVYLLLELLAAYFEQVALLQAIEILLHLFIFLLLNLLTH